MKFQKVLIICVALLLAILALLMMNAITGRNNDPEKKPALETVEILIAPQAYKPGDEISVQKLAWKEWPIQSVNKLYITKGQNDNLKAIEGAIVRFPIFEGEPIMLSNIIKTGGKSVLAAIIRPGMRAVSVPYAKISNSPTLIAPGDIIDIVIPHKTTTTNQDDYEGRTILREVRVLAVDSVMQKMADGTDLSNPKTLTLEVSPDQAEELAASIHEGQLVVSMRSVFVGQEKPTKEKLYKSEPEITSAPSSNDASKSRVISLFRGSERTDVNVK